MFRIASAAAAISLLPAGASSAVQNAPGRNGKIAFASLRDGNFEVYVMNADGTAQTRLTNAAQSDGIPTWSPDGRRLLFTSVREGGSLGDPSLPASDTPAEIYVMNADGSAQTNLSHNPNHDTSPSFSPDGTRIVFASNRDSQARTDYELYTMNADGNDVRRLTTSPGLDRRPAWSPDGTRIAFTTSRDATTPCAGSAATCADDEIYAMDADGSNPVNLTRTPGYSDSFGKWSPDGSKIAFRSLRDLDAEIYVMDADGSNQTRLTTSPGTDTHPEFSADGKSIVFASSRDTGGGSATQIYVMNVDGSNQRRLTTSGVTDQSPAWQRLAPLAVPGAPQTFTDTFTRAGQAKAHAVTIATGRKTARIIVRWTRSGDRFDITRIKLAAKRRLASDDRLKPGRLKITKKRRPKSIEVRIARLKPGRLTFTVKANKVGGPAQVTTRVTQSR
jgi:TolB protein